MASTPGVRVIASVASSAALRVVCRFRRGKRAGAFGGAARARDWHDNVRQGDSTELFPFILGPVLIGRTILFAAVFGVLAGMAPAMQAVRLDPAVAIHG